MNLYIRYFDHEALAKSIDEAMDFLKGIQEIKLDNSVPGRIENFINASNTFPLRLKVSYSNYVLFLKTEAQNLDEFHEMEQKRKEEKAEGKLPTMADRKRSLLDMFNEIQEGWYEAGITFKRVVLVPDTNKFQYEDTKFRVRCYAESISDCYNQIINHLKGRQDIDQRSQYPSIKSNNFEYKFLGAEEPVETDSATEPAVEEPANDVPEEA